MYQDRGYKGRFYSVNRKTTKIHVRIELLKFQMLRILSTDENTTIPDLIRDLIDDAFMLYATKGITPSVGQDVDDRMIIAYDLRVTQATRSMLNELAEASGMTISETLRSIIEAYVSK